MLVSTFGPSLSVRTPSMESVSFVSLSILIFLAPAGVLPFYFVLVVGRGYDTEKQRPGDITFTSIYPFVHAKVFGMDGWVNTSLSFDFYMQLYELIPPLIY
jgi:hypothetical protein